MVDVPDRGRDAGPSLPRITIVTPSFNQGAYIEATIRSVLEQGYPDLQYFVIDGGSTDDTLDVLRRYEDRLRWRSEPDRGQAHAINKGLRRSSGDVLGFLNSDDTYEPGALLRVGGFFAAHPTAHWLTGRCRTIDAAGREIRRPITVWKNFWLAIRSYPALMVLNYLSQPATFWRRSVIETVGEFDESLTYAMDYDYSLRVGRRYRLWTVPDYLASFRVHATSKAGASASAQFDADMQIVRRYTRSRLLLGLHALHSAAAVAMYRLLLPRAEPARDVRGRR